jgi:hypothetical protein
MKSIVERVVLDEAIAGLEIRIGFVDDFSSIMAGCLSG